MSGQYGSKPRKNPGVKGSNPHLKAMRRREAEERSKIWNDLTAEMQLSDLNTRFPNGAKKQKERLKKNMLAAPKKGAKK